MENPAYATAAKKPRKPLTEAQRARYNLQMKLYMRGYRKSKTHRDREATPAGRAKHVARQVRTSLRNGRQITPAYFRLCLDCGIDFSNPDKVSYEAFLPHFQRQAGACLN